MATEITMPKLSDTMEEGKILHWLKRPGDRVRRGEAIAEVETDKADMVLESFQDGILKEIKLPEGATAPVGAVIAILAAEGEEVAAETASAGSVARETSSQTIELTQDKAVPFSDGRESDSAQASASRPSEEELTEKSESFAPDSERRWEETEAAEQKSEHEEVTFGSIEERSMRRGDFAADAAHEVSSGAVTQPSGARVSSISEGAGLQRAGIHPVQRIKASPLARRAAEEAGIDLSHVRGTGPEGRITKRDVDRYLREQQLFKHRRLVTPREGKLGSFEEMSKMRQTIAQRMVASKREIPHFYVTVEIDMEEAVRFKESIEAAELFDEDITYNDIIIKACALALLRYPRLNASYENGGIRIHPDINIGIAVAVEDGLVVPVIRECQRLSLAEIAQAAHRLVAKAAQGGFTSAELSGGTFTISNMGMLGVEHFAAVINPPQAAILAVSAIKERPVVRKGQVVVGKTMMVTISCDHRIVDGAVAGRFLQELRRFLENPATLLLE